MGETSGVFDYAKINQQPSVRVPRHERYSEYRIFPRGRGGEGFSKRAVRVADEETYFTGNNKTAAGSIR